MMVVSLSSLQDILKLAFVYLLRPNSKDDLARYILSNNFISVLK